MTCHFRHLKEIFKKARIEVTNEDRKEIDMTIHKIVGVKYKNCPDVGREVKKRMAEDEADFVSQLITAWKERKSVQA